MTVLVAVASRHGATRGVADQIGETLREALTGLGEDADVDVLFAENVYDVSGYDAFVLGSAVYNGRWLDPARRLVEWHREELAAWPVWLFSSGGTGRGQGWDGVDVTDLVRSCRACEHRVFAGKLDREHLSLPERAVAGALGFREGDYRDWEDIRNWARVVASTLRASRANRTSPSES